ncbi:MAG: hypothetical protein EPO32_07130 [Anaerolineae bacterium]|nr:MAG: hypothetical protein EPO32_07130 [Anaerolineae bacterium]
MAGKRLVLFMHLITILALLAGCASPPEAAPTATPRPAAPIPTPVPAATAVPEPPKRTEILIDGYDEDWSAYPVNRIDPAGDGSYQTDILEVAYFANDCFLYIRIKAEQPSGIGTFVGISYDGNGGGLIIRPDGITDALFGEQHVQVAFAYAKRGDVIEIKVAHSELPAVPLEIGSVEISLGNQSADEAPYSPDNLRLVGINETDMGPGGCPVAVAQNLTTSGTVSRDESWIGEITLTGDVTVPAGVTLTIQPGTTVYLTPDSDDQTCCGNDPNDPNWKSEEVILINAVDGILIAEGTSDQPIVFEPLDEPSGLLSLLFQKGQRASWDGIRVGRGSRITHTQIAQAQIGVQVRGCQNCAANDAARAATEVRNSSITDSRHFAIAVNDADATLVRNDLNRAGKAAIAVNNAGDLRIANNKVRNSPKGLQINNGSGTTLQVLNNLFIDNGTAIEAAQVADLEIINNTVALVAGAAGEWTSGDEVITTDDKIRGISVFPAARTRIVNNLIAGEFDWAIGLHGYPTEFMEVAHNIYHEVAEPYAGEGQSMARTPVPGMDEGNLEADPMFVGGTAEEPDFHLSEGSPAIDAGAPDLLDPDGSPSDIGAYGGPDAAGWDD